MLIGLDYDGTYSLEPVLWKKFIVDCRKLGHEVICVTMRKPQEALSGMPCNIIYTSRKAKVPYVKENTDYKVDVWIDDNPQFLLNDAFEFEKEV